MDVANNWRAAGEKVSHLSACIGHSENVIGGGGTDQSETNPISDTAQCGPSGTGTEGSHMDEVSGGALKVLFFLEPSCYATVLLREIMKTKEPLF